MVARLAERFEVELALTDAERLALRALVLVQVNGLAKPPSFTLRFAVGFGLSLFAAAVLVALDVIEPRAGGGVAAMLALIYFVGIYLQYWISERLHRRSARVQLRASPLDGVPVRMTLEPDGIFVSAAIVEAMWRWIAFRDVEKRRDLLVFWHGPLSCFGIPIRSFADSAEAERALTFARARIAAARARVAAARE